jgi:ATP-dependent Zn protease
MKFNEQFTNARGDIILAKELVKKVIYEYSMSENFVVTPYQEEELMKESVSEVKALTKTLEKALDEVSAYLLLHENISHDECKEILREIF